MRLDGVDCRQVMKRVDELRLHFRQLRKRDHVLADQMHMNDVRPEPAHQFRKARQRPDVRHQQLAAKGLRQDPENARNEIEKLSPEPGRRQTMDIGTFFKPADADEMRVDSPAQQGQVQARGRDRRSAGTRQAIVI